MIIKNGNVKKEQQALVESQALLIKKLGLDLLTSVTNEELEQKKEEFSQQVDAMASGYIMALGTLNYYAFNQSEKSKK